MAKFLNARLMRDEGVPRLGFTWYSLTDQVDWDVALGDERGLVNPAGLYDLDRRPRTARSSGNSAGGAAGARGGRLAR